MGNASLALHAERGRLDLIDVKDQKNLSVDNLDISGTAGKFFRDWDRLDELASWHFPHHSQKFLPTFLVCSLESRGAQPQGVFSLLKFRVNTGCAQ